MIARRATDRTKGTIVGHSEVMNSDRRASAAHLFWRAGMGLSPAELIEREGRSHAELVDELFPGSNTWEPIAVGHVNTTREQYRRMKPTEQARLRRANRQNTILLNLRWFERLTGPEDRLREKMALFWHGHFACWSHWSRGNEHYMNTLREHALGNFGELLKAVSRAPAMLEYLNNQQNRKDAPNENFAREVMELFTLGRGHYTEQDIQEAARAFTGWGFDRASGDFEFREQWHDGGEKTFRGATGNFDGDAILDAILADPQCALFICRKIYRGFVNVEVDDDFVQRMAHRFRESGLDIEDLLRFVFMSEEFMSPHNRGARIKSPIDLLAGIGRLFSVNYLDDDTPIFLQHALGQVLLRPPSVAGWTEGRGWIDSNSLMLRIKLPSALLNNGVLDADDPEEAPEDVDLQMQGAGDAPMRDVRGRILKVASDRAALLAQLPKACTDRELCDLLLQVDPTPALLAELAGRDDMDRVLLILSSPEYQLC